MAVAASRAEAPGPSGFSFASIRIASFGKLCTRARASIGSVTIRNASAADAAADRLRNERRDAEGRLKSLPIAPLVGAILQKNRHYVRALTPPYLADLCRMSGFLCE